MKKPRSRKTYIFFGMILSLFAVFVTALTTAAWFALGAQPASFENQAATTSLAIHEDEITGYKIASSLGSDGFPDYTSTTVASKKGTTYETTNNNQDTADTNFDVPRDGIGYYLIKKNPGDTYKYKYSDSYYSWKFAETTESGVHYLTIPSIEGVKPTDSFIIRNYSYESAEYKTVNVKIDVSADAVGSVSVDPITHEISVANDGNYRVWFDKDNKTVSFEEKLVTATANKASRIANVHANPRRAIVTDTAKSYILLPRNGTVGAWPGVSDLKGASSDTHSIETLGEASAALLDDGMDYYYYEFPASSKDLYIYFKQSNQYYAGHISNQENTFAAGTAYVIENFEFLYNNAASEQYYYGEPYASFNSTDWQNPSIVGLVLSSTTYTVTSGEQKTYYCVGKINNSVPYAYAWRSEINPSQPEYWPNRNAYFPGEVMEFDVGNRYKITVSSSFDYIIFSDGTNSHQTSNLSTAGNSASDGKCFVYGDGWQSNTPSKTTRTYYLYDPDSRLDYSGAPYLFAYDANGSYSNAASPGTAMATTDTTDAGTYNDGRLWKLSVSESYDRLQFTDGRSAIISKTNEITVSSIHDNAIYVLTGGSGTSLTGDWFVDIPTSDTQTYYYFDNRAEAWNAPKAYVWCAAALDGETPATNSDGIKLLYAPRNSDTQSAGVVMNHIGSEEASTKNVDENHVWYITVSKTYDRLIFTNGNFGGENQTIDLQLSTADPEAATESATIGYDEWFFVIDGTQQSGQSRTGKWCKHIYSVEYYGVYFLDDGEENYTKLQFDGISAELFGGFTGYTFWTDEYTIDTDDIQPAATIQKRDSDHGIIYAFDRVGTEFYLDEDCSEAFINDGSHELRVEDGVAKIYIKYSMTASRLKTVYVDDTAWNNELISLKASGNDDTYFTADEDSLWHVASGLYRLTMRDDWFFQLSSKTNTNYALEMPVPYMGSGINTQDRNNSEFLRIQSTGSSSSWTWLGYKPTATTDVFIQKYENSNWTDIRQLLQGDGHGNDYIYESGEELTNGDIIRVYDKNSGTAYGYSSYVDVNKPLHTYIATHQVENDGDSFVISNLGNNERARFNFYITHDDDPAYRKLSVAMVPHYGNGYYIMEYNEAYGTNNFIGAIKMDSTDYTASYDGWYCGDPSKQIFIRSYLNAVDNICTSLTANSSTYATIKTVAGADQYCITFKEAGYYNIRVNNQRVDISEYHVDDFFSVNRLDSALVSSKDTNNAKQQEIWRQKTAVVIEIPFTANNVFDANAKLRTECSASFVGVRFAVYTSKLGDPYNTLHAASSATYTSSYLEDASDPEHADSQNCTITAGTSTKCYAYVLIDYRYTVTNEDLLLESAPEIGLYLQIVQA